MPESDAVLACIFVGASAADPNAEDFGGAVLVAGGRVDVRVEFRVDEALGW